MANFLTRATMAMRSPSSSKLLVAIALGNWACLSAAAPQVGAAPRTYFTPAACPVRLVTQQSASVDGGWEANRSATTSRLSAVTFFAGPTAGQAQLIETTSRRSGSTEIATWVFQGKRNPIYLACLYNGTDLIVSRSLPREVKQCSVTTNLRDRTVPDMVTCR